MAYNKTTTTDLLDTLDSSTNTISDVLEALVAMRALLFPEQMTQGGLLKNVDPVIYVAQRGREAEVSAYLTTLREQIVNAQTAFNAVLSARNAITTGITQPVEAAQIGGAAWTLVKNWNFGTLGNIGTISALEAEFNTYNVFGTFDNGNQYGSKSVATRSSLALAGQPVDPSFADPTQPPFREFTANSMLTHIRPVPGSTQPLIGPWSQHNAGSGSIFSKFTYPSGGSSLGKSIVWETRFRIVNPKAGHWFALWTVGSVWDGGPEMDVIEAFSAYDFADIAKAAWHSDPIGTATNTIDYDPDWFAGQTQTGYPTANQENYLDRWHTITWVYRLNNTYTTYMDGVLISSGNLTWVVPQGGSAGTVPNMQFLFDFAAGNVNVGDTNYTSLVLTLDALPITYEIDYSRVYERNT